MTKNEEFAVRLDEGGVGKFTFTKPDGELAVAVEGRVQRAVTFQASEGEIIISKKGASPADQYQFSIFLKRKVSAVILSTEGDRHLAVAAERGVAHAVREVAYDAEVSVAANLGGAAGDDLVVWLNQDGGEIPELIVDILEPAVVVE